MWRIAKYAFSDGRTHRSGAADRQGGMESVLPYAEPVRQDASMTARSEILSAIPAVAAVDGTFTVGRSSLMGRRGSKYSASTISTHIVSKMCRDAPDNHAVTFDDLERVGRGRYRLVRRWPFHQLLGVGAPLRI